MALTAWRFVQGLAQGTFFVCAVLTILTIFPARIAIVGFAIFAETSLSGAASAAALGGYFVDTNQWTMMFVVFAALAVVAGVTVRSLTPDTAPLDPQPRFDGLGVTLAVVASSCFLVVTQYGERDDWFSSATINAYTALLVVVGIGFVVGEGRLAKDPFLDLRIFGFHNLRWGSILGFIVGVRRVATPRHDHAPSTFHGKDLASGNRRSTYALHPVRAT